MNEKQLTAAARKIGMPAITKMIARKTSALRERDGMVHVADLIDEVVQEINSKQEEAER